MHDDVIDTPYNSCRQKLFISWSGRRSKAIAEALRRWIPMVLQAVDPWVSTDDIAAGSRWSIKVGSELETTKFGVICVTPENIQAPWLLFEAGALSKTIGTSVVCPYLHEILSTDLPGPLGQFQAVDATRSGTLRMLRSINETCKEIAISEDQLTRTFDRWWPDLDEDLQLLPPPSLDTSSLRSGTSFLGLEAVYPTRAAGLEHFTRFLTHELKAASPQNPGRFWVVGSSLHGLMIAAGKGFHEGTELLSQAVRSECDIRILMTDPDAAAMRASQEGRTKDEIEGEVMGSLARLRREGIRREQVKYYPGTPTVFAITTTDTMLLNPYPYEARAFSCFSIVARNTSEEGDIFDQYIQSHFEKPWAHARNIPSKHWDDPEQRKSRKKRRR